MRISKKSICTIALILGCSMIWFFTLSQSVHAKKNTFTFNKGIINIYVKMAKDNEGKFKIRKGISGDTIYVTWKREAPGVFCKKTKWYEADIEHPRGHQWLVKRAQIGKKDKGLCSFTKTTSFNYLELSALYFSVKDEKNKNEFSTNRGKIEDNLYNYFLFRFGTRGGGTFKEKFTAIGKIWFGTNIKTVFGSTPGTERIKQFDVQWHFIDVTPKPAKVYQKPLRPLVRPHVPFAPAKKKP